MKRDIYIHTIGTSVPDRSLKQDRMLDMILRATPDDKAIQSLIKKLYEHSGITNRHTVIEDFYGLQDGRPFIPGVPSIEDGPSTAARNELFTHMAPKLVKESSEKALGNIPGIDPRSITHLVIATCTGFIAPGLDISLIIDLGLSPYIARFCIGFMGCLASVPALRLAHSICLSEPDAKVLVVAAELCSIHYHHRFDTDSLVANSLFADGASAALVSSDSRDGNGHGFIIRSFMSRMIPGTQDDMTWMIGNHGFEMTISKFVPSAIERNIERLASDSCAKAGVGKDAIRHWAIHPGGRAILDRSATALGLDKAALGASYEVLRGYGNMSSATLLFVLDSMFRSASKGPIFMAAFGPGLTAETCVLEAF